MSGEVCIILFNEDEQIMGRDNGCSHVITAVALLMKKKFFISVCQ